MDLLHLRVFQRQVVDQCRLVLGSVPAINQGAATGDHDALWMACQMFVVGAGNLSKAFWGEGRGRQHIAPRRQSLRDSLAVEDSSPLYSVGIRNHFEHYDERIDRWWAESSTHNHADRMIGSPDQLGGLTDIEMFRIYDPGTVSIVFWGQQYELQPIASEVDRIYPIALREANKPHWG
jgi:hypothetical protein